MARGSSFRLSRSTKNAQVGRTLRSPIYGQSGSEGVGTESISILQRFDNYRGRDPGAEVYGFLTAPRFPTAI